MVPLPGKRKVGEHPEDRRSKMEIYDNMLQTLDSLKEDLASLVQLLRESNLNKIESAVMQNRSQERGQTKEKDNAAYNEESGEYEEDEKDCDSTIVEVKYDSVKDDTEIRTEVHNKHVNEMIHPAVTLQKDVRKQRSRERRMRRNIGRCRNIAAITEGCVKHDVRMRSCGRVLKRNKGTPSQFFGAWAGFSNTNLVLKKWEGLSSQCLLGLADFLSKTLEDIKRPLKISLIWKFQLGCYDFKNMYEKQQEKWLTIRYDMQRKQDEWKERNDVNRERAVDDKDPFTLEDYILISYNFLTLRCQLQFPMNQSWNLSLFCKMKPWKWKHNGETEAPLVLNVVGLLFDETNRANVLSPSLILKLMQRKTRITHFLDVSPSFILGLLQIIACVTKYCYCSDWAEIRDALLANAYTSGVIEGLKNDPTSFPGFTFTGQILSYKGRVVIPEEPHLRQKILYECHNTPAAAHGGFLKTIKVHTNVLATPLIISDLRTSRLFGREVLIRS